MSDVNAFTMDDDIVWHDDNQIVPQSVTASTAENPAPDAWIDGIADLLGRLRTEIDDNMDRLSAMRDMIKPAPDVDTAIPEADEVQTSATSSSCEDLTVEDACIIGGSVLALGGLAYMAYRTLMR